MTTFAVIAQLKVSLTNQHTAQQLLEGNLLLLLMGLRLVFSGLSAHCETHGQGQATKRLCQLVWLSVEHPCSRLSSTAAAANPLS